MKTIKIGNSEIGDSSPAFFIAELSANHNQDFELAKRTILAMKESGADAVKVQTFTPDTLTIDCKKEDFMIRGTLWDGRNLYELYKEARMPWEWHEPLQKLSASLGMEFLSTPTDKSSADYLEKLNVPVYKIASFEITDTGLIEHIAAKGKPVILSTGIAGEEEIADALACCKRKNNEQVILLKCTSSYPTPWNEVNLNAMVEMKKKYGTLVGISDHTMGDVITLGAVAMGAKVVEKHFILDRTLGGPDASFSMEPSEFRAMVDKTRILEQSLGNGKIEPSESSLSNRKFARSLYAVEDIPEGTVFNEKNIRSIRPGFGMKPKYLADVLGKIASQDIERGTALSQNMIV